MKTRFPNPSRTAGLLKGCAVAVAWAAVFPAQADSSVTIYGIIDQGVSRAFNGTTPNALLPGKAQTGEKWTIKAGNTSRLGFRGQEDLGNDAYARFQFEHRFAADTGAASNDKVFWLGRSVVAAGTKDLGEIYAGREYSAAYWVPLFADPTSWSYVSQLATPYTYANYTAVASSIEASNIRWANSVGYKSANLSGVTFELATALGEGVRKRATSGNAQYKQGPLWLGLGFDQLDSQNNLAILAGGYDFGAVFPTATYSKSKGGTKGDATSYSLSVRAPVSYGRVYASYGRLDTFREDRSKPDLGASQMVSAGTEYNLSKRSLLYFNAASAKLDKQSRTSALDFGLKHTF